MIAVRKAKPEDAEQLDRVMRVISTGGIQNLEKAQKMIEDIAKDDRQYLMVAIYEEENTIVGSLYGMVFPDICEDGRPILLIENVAVLESSQRMGVGKVMFDEIEKFGERYHCHYQMLVSGFSRTGAHRFYQKIGFEEAKGYKKYYNP